MSDGAPPHEGQPDERPELHQARGIARNARTLQSQIEAYRGLVESPIEATPRLAEQRLRRA